MSQNLLCAQCQNHIVGHINKYKNNLYCDHCYEKIMTELTRIEVEKNQLYDFIEDLFSIKEIPQHVLNAIDRALEEGKKLTGIRGTLIYYYKIKENPTDDINFVGSIIQREYSNAATYFAEEKRIKEINKNININVPPVTVRIKPRGGRDKIKYKMEDI